MASEARSAVPALALLILLGTVAGCGSRESTNDDTSRPTTDSTRAPVTGEPSEPSDWNAEEWLGSALLPSGTTPEEVVRRFGEPDRRSADPTPNRHIPDQTDSIITLAYDRGLSVTFYAITGGRSLLQSLSVTEAGILPDGPIDVGARWEEVTDLLGAPDGRRSGRPYYVCASCGEAEEPVSFGVEDGVVRSVRFEYYVD